MGLNNIEIAAPCSQSWDKMKGNDTVRFCQECKLNVYNISEMTTIEAEKLISTKEGRLCIRYYKRKDGTIITNNCPIGLRVIKKRAQVILASALSIITGLFSLSAITKETETTKPTKMGKYVRPELMGELGEMAEIACPLPNQLVIYSKVAIKKGTPLSTYNIQLKPITEDDRKRTPNKEVFSAVNNLIPDSVIAKTVNKDIPKNQIILRADLKE
jgi:hypothetical protein